MTTATTIVPITSIEVWNRWQALDQVLNLLEPVYREERCWAVRRELAQAINRATDAAGEMVDAYPDLRERLALEDPEVWGEDDEGARR